MPDTVEAVASQQIVATKIVISAVADIALDKIIVTETAVDSVDATCQEEVVVVSKTTDATEAADPKKKCGPGCRCSNRCCGYQCSRKKIWLLGWYQMQ